MLSVGRQAIAVVPGGLEAQSALPSAMLIAEHSAKALTNFDTAALLFSNFVDDQSVADSLVVAPAKLMLEEASLSSHLRVSVEEDHPVEAFIFHGSHSPLK